MNNVGLDEMVMWLGHPDRFNSVRFFLCGYLKGVVYETIPTTPEDMKERIKQVSRSIPVTMLRKTKRNY